jgi:hypothetical protein
MSGNFKKWLLTIIVLIAILIIAELFYHYHK